MKIILRLLAIFSISACVADGGASTSRISKLSAELAEFQSDPKIIEFLAIEAAKAGIREIRGYVDTSPDASYGNVDSKMIIRLNIAKSGGTSVVNITHEIAHAASGLAGGCGGHGTRWLAAYVAIAERFEAQFPGVKWSRMRPVDRVLVNRTRYSIGTKCR